MESFKDGLLKLPSLINAPKSSAVYASVLVQGFERISILLRMLARPYVDINDWIDVYLGTPEMSREPVAFQRILEIKV